MKSQKDMLHGPVWATFLRYSLPWALSMLASGSASIIDGIFIGRYAGAIALASVNMIAPLWGIMAGVGIMLAAGGTAITGNYMGKGDIGAASAMLLKTVISVLAWSALFFAALFCFQEQTLDMLGATGELRRDSHAYLRVFLYFSPVFPLCFTLSYFVRLDGRPVMASMGLLLSAAINAPLDWWFIGIEGLGVYGAALATGIAYAVPCLLYSCHFISARCAYIWPKNLGKWSEVLNAAWNGASEFVNETSAGLVMLLFNLSLVKSMGVMGVAAYTVIGYMGMMGGLLSYGFADTLTPLVSVNNGAGKKRRMLDFLACSSTMVLGMGCLLLLCLTLWPAALVDIFLPAAPRAREIALDFIAIARWEFLFLGLNMAFTSYFTGRLWATASFSVAVCRGLALPCLFLWLLPRILGAEGIFYVPPLTEALTFCVALAILLLGVRKTSRAARAGKAAG